MPITTMGYIILYSLDLNIRLITNVTNNENLGGIRIEDVVVVTKKGCEILSKFPKRFQV